MNKKEGKFSYYSQNGEMNDVSECFSAVSIREP